MTGLTGVFFLFYIFLPPPKGSSVWTNQQPPFSCPPVDPTWVVCFTFGTDFFVNQFICTEITYGPSETWPPTVLYDKNLRLLWIYGVSHDKAGERFLQISTNKFFGQIDLRFFYWAHLSILFICTAVCLSGRPSVLPTVYQIVWWANRIVFFYWLHRFSLSVHQYFRS